MSSKKNSNVIKKFDDFTNHTSISHKNMISSRKSIFGYTLKNTYDFKINKIITKDIESYFLGCNIEAKDWFYAKNGNLYLNCDQQIIKLEFTEQHTEVKDVGETIYCYEYGFYILTEQNLKDICSANVIKIRICGDHSCEEPNDLWCKQFQNYLKEFAEEVCDIPAIAEQQAKLKILTDDIKVKTNNKNSAITSEKATKDNSTFSKIKIYFLAAIMLIGGVSLVLQALNSNFASNLFKKNASAVSPVISNANVSTAVSPTLTMGHTDNQQIKKTRYGSLRFIDKNEKITLFFNDQIFAIIDGNSFNNFGESFVVNEKDIVVFYSLAGGGCGTYQFISVSNRTSASMSQSFSSCGEIFFKQDNSKIFTESMDYQGENKKQVIYENGLISENNRNVFIKVSDDSCVEDKVRLFERRFEAKITRDEKSLKGEEFHLSAVRMSEIQDDARKTAMASCAIEKDAIVTGIPSFDCSKANQRIDQLICSNKELAALDVQLSNSFKSVRYFSKNKDAFLANSRNWLNKRQECEDAACLIDMYNNRIIQLQKIID